MGGIEATMISRTFVFGSLSGGGTPTTSSSAPTCHGCVCEGALIERPEHHPVRMIRSCVQKAILVIDGGDLLEDRGKLTF
jgi:hypothetical protein